MLDTGFANERGRCFYERLGYREEAVRLDGTFLIPNDESRFLFRQKKERAREESITRRRCLYA